MEQIRRVLVPLDGSPLANAALPMAVALARPLGASVLLVRAVLSPRDVAAAQRALDAVAREVRGNEVEASTRVLVGAAAEMLPAQVEHLDLMVLGLGSRPDFGVVTCRLLEGTAPIVLRRAGGRRVRRIERVCAEGAGPAARFGADLARDLGVPCVTLEPADPQASSACDLLVVGRERANLALDLATDVAVLVV